MLYNYEKYYPTCLFIMNEGEKQAKPQGTAKSYSHTKDSLIQCKSYWYKSILLFPFDAYIYWFHVNSSLDNCLDPHVL